MTPPRSTTATVLLTDLSRSTEIMTSLGDAEFDALRGEHFRRLLDVIAAHGGTSVKTTGDGVLATFASSVDALGAAVEAQQAAEAHGRSASIPIAIRVGMAIGEVGLEDGDVFGTPVVEAARLVDAAHPGQILCTALVRIMAGSRAGVSFSDVGPLALKGLPEPVPVCSVPWSPVPEVVAPLPLPAVLTRRSRVFVDRHEEFARLEIRWKEVVTAGRRLVLMGGEPGIGKTHLAIELAERLHAAGALVLAGRCDEDLGVSYQPIVESLRHYVTHGSDLRLGIHAGELVRLVPEVADAVPGLPAPLRSDPETETYRLFDAVAAWLAAVTEREPALLVIDDLHWATKPTVLLLRHILRFASPMRLLVLATYRDSDVGRGSPLSGLLADVTRFEEAERLPLDGFGVDDVAAYVEAVNGEPLQDDALARAVWQEAAGNPLFTAEVLRHLRESGAFEEQRGRWVLTAPVDTLGIPEGVRDVVGRRLTRLSDETNRVLSCAAVVGDEFEPAVVQVAGQFSEEIVCAALEEALSARLVIEVPGSSPVRNRFRHALVRATLYDEITAARRATLHRRVGEAIEAVHTHRVDDHLPALAHHWTRAASPSTEAIKAIDYVRRAGDVALAQLAHDEAIAYYRQGLDLLDGTGAPAGDRRRLELLIALGEAQRRAGDGEHRETLLEAARLARDAGHAGLLARAALSNTRGMYASSAGAVDAERVAVLESALASVGPEDSAVRARLLGALGQELAWAGDRQRRARLSDEALAIARRLDDPATLASVLQERSFTLSGPDLLPERQACAGELLSVATSLGEPVKICQALVLRFRGHAEAGELDEADAYLARAETLAAEVGQPTLRWTVGLLRAGRVLLAGDVAAGERLALEGLELGLATGQPDAPVLFAGLLFVARFEQGRLEEIEGQITDVAEKNPGLPGTQAFLALCRAETGRLEAARQPYERLAATGFAVLPLDSVWLMFNCAVSVVCARLDDRAGAARLRDHLAPFAHQFVFTAAGAWGSVSHYLGLLAATLGDYDEADSRFGAAAAVHERIGAPTWLARSRLEWARMLLMRSAPGDRERARTLLARALATAAHLQQGRVERACDELLSEPPGSAPSRLPGRSRGGYSSVG